MFTLSLLSATTLALSALNANAAVLPRTVAPQGYATGYLEDYTIYHTRYLALGCQFQHGKPFFDKCCHPMLATENLKDNRAPECTPSASASSSVAAVLATADDDEPSSVIAETPSSTPEYTPAFSSPSPTTHAHSHKPKPTTSPSEPAPSPSGSSNSPGSSSSGNDLAGLVTGGFGTYFYQNGVAGACGTVHSDDDLIVAMDVVKYGDTTRQSDLCGKKVQIFNNANGKSVTCTVADACPTCNNGNSIDMSVGAFRAISELSVGLVDISWRLV